MHLTKIQVFKIAQTRVNWPEVDKWLKAMGVKDTHGVIGQIGTDEAMDYVDLQLGSDAGEGVPDAIGTDASALIALCGKRCYASFEVGLNPNVTKIRTDHAEYITNILKSGHGSVLEHATWSFAIENISRVFTGEMNRHRAGCAISEASMRYIRFDDIGFTMPNSLEIEPLDQIEHDLMGDLGGDRRQTEAMRKFSNLTQKEKTQNIFQEAFQQMEQWNIDLCNIWKIGEMTDFTKKKQLTSMFRRIIGMGVSTGGIWTLNARALRHVLAMRGSTHAEEEIYEVFDQIAQMMIKDEPLLFGDFEKNSEGSWIPKYPKV